MSSITAMEKMVVEKLYGMGSGYVLNFSDATYANFFKSELKIDINDKRFHQASGSKAHRMRGFWQVAGDQLVGQSLLKMIAYIDTQILLGVFKPADYPQDLTDRTRSIAGRLLGASPVAAVTNEKEFTEKRFGELSVDKLELGSAVSEVLNQRIQEIKKCLSAGAPLAAIFLCGSSLEGILLGLASKKAKEFNQCPSSPKDNAGKVKQLSDWNLNELINVARSLGLIGEDVKKFSHALRDFRNYIHPFQQMSADFHPDMHTARICWQVLQAAVTQLSTRSA